MLTFSELRELDLKQQALELQIKEMQKAAERAAIIGMLAAKMGTLTTLKQNSTAKLDEIESALYTQTNQSLPNDLEGALLGKGAKSAKNFLKGISKFDWTTPVKRG